MVQVPSRGEIPGPLGRADAGWALGWTGTSFWCRPAASTSRPLGSEVAGISRTSKWLVGSAGCDFVDSQEVCHLRRAVPPAAAMSNLDLLEHDRKTERMGATPAVGATQVEEMGGAG